MHCDFMGNLAVLLFMLKALLECIGGTLIGLLLAPFLKEKPKLSFQPTAQNEAIVDKCPALQNFASSPWAPGAISQTVLGLAVQVGTPEYQRREVVVAPDGVELLLDFKEGPDTPEDAPLMMILHGIGGNSKSRLARLLADACVAQGWRAVVYNRRGHGQSTLLPAPLVQPPPEPNGATTDKVRYQVEKAATVVASGILHLPRSLTKAALLARKVASSKSGPGGTGISISDDEQDQASVGCTGGLFGRWSHSTLTGTPKLKSSISHVELNSCVPSREPSPVPITHSDTNCAHVKPSPSLLNPMHGRQQELGQSASPPGPLKEGPSATPPHPPSLPNPSPQPVPIVDEKRFTQQQAQQQQHVQRAQRRQRAPHPSSGIAATDSITVGIMDDCEAPPSSCRSDMAVEGTPRTQHAPNAHTPSQSHGILADQKSAKLNSFRLPQPGPASSDGSLSGTPGSVTVEIRAEAQDSSSKHVPHSEVNRLLTRSASLRAVTKVFPAHSNTDDLAVVAAYLAQKYPKAVRLILGFSQGSNLLVHYLGLHASDPPPFAAAICIANAFDLEKGTQLLAAHRPLANAIMAHEIQGLLVKEKAAVLELCEARGIHADIDRALRCSCIREFDGALLVPCYGFKNVDEYYRQQSSGHVLKDVVTPLLCLNNDDDPFIPDKLPDAAAAAACNGPRANIIAARTKGGGHLGWLQGWSGQSWMTDIMLQYSKAVLELVDQGAIPRTPCANQKAL